MRWLDKLKQRLKKTSEALTFHSVDLNEIEEALIMADVGVEVTDALMQTLQAQKPKTIEEVRTLVRRALSDRLKHMEKEIALPTTKPAVILMVGVNGSGKTTTIGKLAAKYRMEGKTVACVAGDTFRAGAVEQLKHWAEKTGSDFYEGRPHCDAASLIFDALQSAKQKGTDIVFIDTAGRLQNRLDLMDELKKIVRVMHKLDLKMPHETILVLDATVGQNALLQVQAFQKVCELTGLVMTKLDGTAKGGILVALSAMNLPVFAVGIGEAEEDLHAFSVEDYVDSILGAP